jgi:hypothetical protein
MSAVGCQKLWEKHVAITGTRRYRILVTLPKGESDSQPMAIETLTGLR